MRTMSYFSENKHLRLEVVDKSYSVQRPHSNVIGFCFHCTSSRSRKSENTFQSGKVSQRAISRIK